MLWSLPERAHPPIVEGRKRTFAASRISAASASVIQSDPEGTIVAWFQSPSLVELADDVPAALDSDGCLEAEPSLFERSVPGVSPEEALLPVDADAADRRSFFAQPLPLNTIAGGANALRIEPSEPHSGQKFGPGSWTPWRMSVRCPQTAQTYS